MLYLDYEHHKSLYENSQKAYSDILSEKEALFAKTLPKSPRTDRERITGGSKESVFEAYLIEKERKQIDARVIEARELMDMRRLMLQRKERELRSNREIINRIYVMRYIEFLKVSKIARKIGYSKSQIYRIIEEIDENIKMRQNATN